MADTNVNGGTRQATGKLKSVESLDQTNEMERGLSNRHVQFIAIGGTIGTGLFLGSGKSLALTGEYRNRGARRRRLPTNMGRLHHHQYR